MVSRQSIGQQVAQLTKSLQGKEATSSSVVYTPPLAEESVFLEFLRVFSDVVQQADGSTPSLKPELGGKFFC